MTAVFSLATSKWRAAMRTWIGAMTLMALLAIGDAGTINVASAAKVITVPQRTQLAPDRTRSATRQDHGAYDRSPYSGWSYYYGRPYFYAPAPFPLGFDFGFGW
jgi:hypothetical protein